MSTFTILYDELQEAIWFRQLNSAFQHARMVSITEALGWPEVQRVLAYDRPDIVLLDDGKPILVVEETVEVPSGHNVGQRFARIAAAAEAGVPAVYFGPYVARKHGGITAGPRYMNLRLFHALDAMERVTGTAVTTINWPVDGTFEVRRDRGKDRDVREYIETFLDLYRCSRDMSQLNRKLIGSPIHRRLVDERASFAQAQIRSPARYDGPPGSVRLLTRRAFEDWMGIRTGLPATNTEIVLYRVGMNNVRSDPYTGMAILYRYLYIAEHPTRALVLWFPGISMQAWTLAAGNGRRKDVRLFRQAADAVRFSNGFALRDGF